MTTEKLHIIEEPEPINNLRALLAGGEGAPDFAPHGMLALKQFTVENFATECRVTRSAVYYYMSGKNRPTAVVLKRMAQVLEIPYELVLEYCTPSPWGRPPRKQRKGE